MREEIYIDLPEFEDRYQISNNGNVYSKITSKILVRVYDSDGYTMVNLYKFKGDTRNKSKKIHRLVAQAFIPNPDNLPQVNHKNGVKTDNNIENLEWCTALHNTTHANKIGLRNNLGSNNPSAKLNENQVREIKIELTKEVSMYKLAKLFNVSQKTIWRIKNNIKWKQIMI